jgi:hypothetical protein
MSQSTYVQKPSEIRMMFVWSLRRMLCVDPMHFNITFSSSSQRWAHSVENTSFHLNPLTGIFYSLAVIPLIHWSALNTPKTLRVSTDKNPEDWGREIVQATAHRKVWFRCCLTVRRKWGGAPPRMNHVSCHRWRGACSKNTGKSIIRKRRYAAPVSLLRKTSGRKSWTPKTPT